MSTGNENKICAKKADAKDWLAEAAHLSVYYEYYGALLPEKQRLIFEDYIANDMSAGRECMMRFAGAAQNCMSMRRSFGLRNGSTGWRSRRNRFGTRLPE